MPFKQNNIISNDNSQSLNDILTAIHQLKSSVDNLNQRLNKLESATNNKAGPQELYFHYKMLTYSELDILANLSIPIFS